MGNSSSKDERKSSRPSSIRNASGAAQQAGPSQASPSSSSHQPTPGERLAGRIYGARNNGNTSASASRNDLSFLHIGRGRDRDDEAAQPDRPRETKQEREARRAERERQARLKERERSMREEHVDGGYLVTVGVYTGPEDFSKPLVRQFQIERRLAPFWKGLNDHNESWTEAQLVAAARGLPIPAADEVPPEMARTGSQASFNARGSDANINSLTVPIGARSQSYQSDRSGLLSASHPAFSTSSGPSSPTSPTSTGSQLFRGRAKTLASLATGNKSQSPDLTPQEIRLPNDPYINGQPLEAYLYKDASECPICFMYYPPYLNRTRCCDQPICSECFVQIKRPDPHPPEHEQPGQPRPPEEEAEMLVSEVAACPFCVTPEFGVTYDPPSFRRGLAYAHQNPLNNPTSAMSSSTSLSTGPTRRRATSLSTKDPKVITTDMVRPDWAKKLADARAHALRRSAAATALHNAAYVLGNQGDGQLRTGFAIGRRRRTLFVETPKASGSATPQEGDGSSRDLVGGRGSSRRGRVEDLEELMMMEAIRLSLAAEEERARKAEKEAAKDAKKKAKDARKEEKKQEKLAKKNGGGSLYHVGTNESTSTWASTSMARSTSNLGTQPPIPEENLQGKGKQPIQDFAGFNPLNEPTSTLNRSASPGHAPHPSTSSVDAQRHLEASRANLGGAPILTPNRTAHLRETSNVSSAASSFVDSAPSSLRGGDSNFPSGAASGVDVTAGAPQIDGSRSGTPLGAHRGESMFNFHSLAAMVDEDKAGADSSQHIEHASKAEEDVKEPSPTGSPAALPVQIDGSRSRGDSGESSSSAPPPVYVEPASPAYGDEITPVPTHTQHHDSDVKEYHSVEILHHGERRETELR
ncbi:Protein SIP5 [Pseudocercospora fuligena]|uniref:Protein SIP5 n=1 Tax=Pseudocercospora fuligena TaxID=685502 RepID=A0A8H6RLJ6_9PEZI|nr:Protein SIP5 [Pseudocercospora fuligena]